MRSNMLRSALAFAISLGLGAASIAQADDTRYPERPITIVVPYSPGGGVDIVTRIVTKKMGDELGQSFIVENKPGAGTNIGMDYVARSNPDGYTLYMASNTITTSKALYSKLSFDPTADFTAVGKVGQAPIVLVVNADSPFKTLQDLVDKGRENAEALSFGTAGVGSSGHLASELLLRSADMKAMHVPYKGGAPAITDLLGGRLSFMSINPLEVISHIQAGKLRALAVLNATGTPLLPDLKTAQAQGVKDLDATVWWGIVAPTGTPEPVIAKLNAALNVALNNDEVKASLAKLGAREEPGTVDAFQAFLEKETTTLTQVIKEANIKAD